VVNGHYYLLLAGFHLSRSEATGNTNKLVGGNQEQGFPTKPIGGDRKLEDNSKPAGSVVVRFPTKPIGGDRKHVGQAPEYWNAYQFPTKPIGGDRKHFGLKTQFGWLFLISFQLSRSEATGNPSRRKVCHHCITEAKSAQVNIGVNNPPIFAVSPPADPPEPLPHKLSAQVRQTIGLSAIERHAWIAPTD
jgi:hypothetical protein